MVSEMPPLGPPIGLPKWAALIPGKPNASTVTNVILVVSYKMVACMESRLSNPNALTGPTTCDEGTAGTLSMTSLNCPMAFCHRRKKEKEKSRIFFPQELQTFFMTHGLLTSELPAQMNGQQPVMPLRVSTTSCCFKIKSSKGISYPRIKQNCHAIHANFFFRNS